MPELALPGCTPEPLMNYLKALGVFRLVAEQADPAATLAWQGGIARLSSRFDREGLACFFQDEYRPTPILAPWNGGSGFYDAADSLGAIETSTHRRLALYRESMVCARKLVPAGKPKDTQKLALLARCRAELPDDVVPWLDVCFVLGEEGASFFPLLGTGGNDGRLDFTNNFFQRLANVIPFAEEAAAPQESSGWLSVALFADTLATLRDTAVGQFNPGGVGGPNGVQGGFQAGSRVNPWDFVLMIEGALLFAGSMARRLGANQPGRAVFPFSVESVAVGYGSATASEETSDGSRAELWLPLWEVPATYPEVGQLFAEGRAQLGRRQARNAVEFALAVNLLGVSRGVTGFTRYGFLKRNGLAFLAAPLGRMLVTPRPAARLLDDPALTAWLDQLRRACREKDKTPARYQTALRQVDRAMFAFANRSEHGNDEKYLADVLIALGRAEQTLAGGLRFAQEKYIRPLGGLRPQWFDQADDHSPEFRLAAALAGVTASKKGEVGPLRVFLEEVEVGKYIKWSPGSTSAVWSNRPPAANLAAVFRRRLLEAYRNGLSGVPLLCRRPARLDDVLAFLRGETDDEKLADLFWGLIAVDWPCVERRKPEHSHEAIPIQFGLPRLVVSGLSLRIDRHHPQPHWKLGKEGDVVVSAEPQVFHALAVGGGGAVAAAVTEAARRLRSDGLTVMGYRYRRHAGRPLDVIEAFCPERLLAAMLFPLSPRDLTRVTNAVLYPPETRSSPDV